MRRNKIRRDKNAEEDWSVQKQLEEVGGNVDYERFQTEILAHLGDGNGLWYQRYDCGRQCLEDGYRVPYTRLNKNRSPVFADETGRSCLRAFSRNGFPWKTDILRNTE